jgi:cell division protein FtsB
MNFGTKRNKPAKKKPARQMPSHVGLVDKLRKRNAALEAQIKKMRGK